MARAVDVIPISPPTQGWDMRTNARKAFTHNSVAEGPYPVGVADAAVNATGSPGASLGTGMNADIYTPGIEAV
jgi:hypothetical protein